MFRINKNIILFLVVMIASFGCGGKSDGGSGSSSTGTKKQIAERIDVISAKSNGTSSSSTNRSIRSNETVSKAFNDAETDYSFYADMNATYNITFDYFSSVNNELESINSFLEIGSEGNFINAGKQQLDGGYYEIKEETTDSNSTDSNSTKTILTYLFKLPASIHKTSSEDAALAFHTTITSFTSNDNLYGEFEAIVGHLLPYTSTGQVDYSDINSTYMAVKVTSTDDNKTKVESSSSFFVVNAESTKSKITQKSILIFDASGGEYKEKYESKIISGSGTEQGMERYASFDKKYVTSKIAFTVGTNYTETKYYDLNQKGDESYAMYGLFDTSTGSMMTGVQDGTTIYNHTADNEDYNTSSPTVGQTFTANLNDDILSFETTSINNKNLRPNVKNGTQITIDGTTYVMAALQKYVSNKAVTIADINATGSTAPDINMTFADINYTVDFSAIKELQP